MMKNTKSTLLTLSLVLLSMNSWAANQPCSGKKGGISHCDGTQFVCNDGSVSKSTKDCQKYMSGSSDTAASTSTTTNTSDSPVNTHTATSSPLPEKTKFERTGDILTLKYDGFTVWLDCKKRGAVKFQYNAQRDTGNAKRAEDFSIDPDVPFECQQTSTKPYSPPDGVKQKYDRGHQVPANHLDSSEAAIKETNYITNILPQTLQLNRGAWLASEEIVECYRDIDELLVMGGAIWGNNTADDYFISSHGVATPDAYWKVIVRGKGQDERAIAWIMPNSAEATRKNLDRYLVTVDEIEKATGETIPVADYAKHEKPSQSWIIPKGCNKS